MTIEQADREHLRLYQAFRALANAAADAHPCIVHDDKRRKFGNALNEAWRVIETTKPLFSPATDPLPLPVASSASVHTPENRAEAVPGKDMAR